MTIRPRPRPNAPSATARTSNEVGLDRVARNHHGKAHGSPSLERVADDDTPTSYTTCTPHHPARAWMGSGRHATATARLTAHPVLSVWLVTIHPCLTPPAPTATTRTSKGMDWGKVARHRYGKAHGSPSLERVAGHDPPTAYATCTPLHTTPPSNGMDEARWHTTATARFTAHPILSV